MTTIIVQNQRRKKMWNNSKLQKKSLLQPIGLEIKKGCYALGDKYIKSLLVTELPRQFDLGLLSYYVANPTIKVFMRTEPLELDCATMLKKEYNDKNREYQNSGNDPTRRETLENELISLNTYIKEIVDNHDTTWNVVIVFNVYGDTEKDVKDRCKDLRLRLRSQGFKVTGADIMQENLMRVATPLFLDSRLPKEVERNIGIPLPSLGLAGLYPFVFETLKDQGGFLLGHELRNAGAILFNQFQWLDDPESARELNRLSGNLVIVGGTGFGKTTTMKLLIRFYIRTHKKIIWIDPENKNRTLTRRYGGTYINWGRRGYLINVFDLKPISVEEDEDPSVMWDTELAIYNCIDDVKIILRYLVPSISDDTLSIIGDQMVKLYADHGLSFGASFKGLSPEAFPTFSDFDERLKKSISDCENQNHIDTKELDLLRDLRLKIKPLLREWSVYFNGHTTIGKNELSKDIIAFGTKTLFEKPTTLINALNHIMFQFAWSLCLDESIESAFVLDEAHTQILTAKSAERVAQYVRRSRKYHNVCTIGTQEPKDFAKDEILEHGKAIFNNCVYKMAMHLEWDGVKELSKLITLNENEMGLIEQLNMGDALFVCGNRRIPIHVLPTQNELKEIA